MEEKCIALTKTGKQCSRNAKRLNRCKQHATIYEKNLVKPSTIISSNEDGEYIEYTLNPMYLIYNDGKIYSRYINKFISARPSNGYLTVCLACKEKKSTIRIHRLVALHFVKNPNPELFNVVDHIDGNRENNHYSNLRWTSCKGNVANAFRNGMKSGNTKKVTIYDEDRDLIGIYESFTKASIQTGISTRTIYKSVKNQCIVSSQGVKYYCECENYSAKVDVPENGKKIPNFSDNYLVTSDGLIYSKFKKGFLKQETSKDGYKRVGLKHKNRKEKFSVHRLVAELFIPNSDEKKTQVNHKDGDKSNNNVSNLEWVTPSENGIHRIKLHPKLSRPVLQLDPKTYEIIKRYDSMKNAAIAMKKHRTSRGNCVRGHKRTCAGFKWRYEDEDIKSYDRK